MIDDFFIHKQNKQKKNQQTNWFLLTQLKFILVVVITKHLSAFNICRMHREEYRYHKNCVF